MKGCSVPSPLSIQEKFRWKLVSFCILYGAIGLTTILAAEQGGGLPIGENKNKQIHQVLICLLIIWNPTHFGEKHMLTVCLFSL